MSSWPLVADLGIGFRSLAIALDAGTEDVPSIASARTPPGPHIEAASNRGGVALALQLHPPRQLVCALPQSWRVVVIRPEQGWDNSRVLRDALPRELATLKHFRQAALLLALSQGLLTGDAELVKLADADAVIEPAVGPRLPAFFPATGAAREAGAIFVALDPNRVALVALTDSASQAAEVQAAVEPVFARHAMTAHTLIAAPAPLQEAIP